MTHAKIEEFWRWFLDRKTEMDVLVDSDSALWAQALAQLKAIDSRLWFELSRPDGEPRELIVTAAGDKEVFGVVEEMIARAPNFPDWRFFALKPAMGFDFVTTYEGVKFDPKRMWFQPLESASDPSLLALRVGMPNFTPKIKREAENAIFVILETALGERSVTLDITHAEVCALPRNPEAEGFLELPELAGYISWHKGKYASA